MTAFGFNDGNAERQQLGRLANRPMFDERMTASVRRRRQGAIGCRTAASLHRDSHMFGTSTSFRMQDVRAAKSVSLS
jgi:hypothetical protein